MLLYKLLVPSTTSLLLVLSTYTFVTLKASFENDDINVGVK